MWTIINCRCHHCRSHIDISDKLVIVWSVMNQSVKSTLLRLKPNWGHKFFIGIRAYQTLDRVWNENYNKNIKTKSKYYLPFFLSQITSEHHFQISLKKATLKIKTIRDNLYRTTKKIKQDFYYRSSETLHHLSLAFQRSQLYSKICLKQFIKWKE